MNKTDGTKLEPTKLEPKRIVAWLVMVAGLVGIALTYAAIWVIINTFAAGVGWYANLALVARAQHPPSLPPAP